MFKTKLVILDICKYIYHLPLVRNSILIKILNFIVDYDKDLKSPIYHKVRVCYLKKMVKY